jgi:hypothetical protein
LIPDIKDDVIFLWQRLIKARRVVLLKNFFPTVELKILSDNKTRTMRCLFCILFCLASGFISCNKTASEFIIPNGTYSGTFQRLTNAGGPFSNVTISFLGNNWKGQSQYAKYPGLCQGTYTAGPDSITFENACFWTAEFDWSLILNGSYKITISGKSLQISRTYSDSLSDIYLLTRQ